MQVADKADKNIADRFDELRNAYHL